MPKQAKWPARTKPVKRPRTGRESLSPRRAEKKLKEWDFIHRVRTGGGFRIVRRPEMFLDE